MSVAQVSGSSNTAESLFIRLKMVARRRATAAEGSELRRGPVVQRRVRAVVVVIAAPEIQLAPCIGQVEEHLHVQALVAKPTVEALDIAVLDRAPWADEVQMYTVPVGLVIKRLARELCAVVHSDGLGHPTLR